MKTRIMSLGEIFLKNFNVGDYVTWRVLSGNIEIHYCQYQGIITEIVHYDDDIRPVYYAKILENKSAQIFCVVLSCLTKIETN
jgi:hypothetical protein|tara:strand:+ start:124 stop:372 length:249 start_codon:yes stop_codon:yes gene_type:complete